MDNRRLILAVVLSLVILVGWQYFFPTPKPSPPVERPAATAQGGEEAEVGSDRGAGSESSPEARPRAENTPGEEVSEVSTDAAAEPTPEEPPIAAQYERQVTVETKRFQAVLTNRGAQIVSFVLREHQRSDGAPLDLVRQRDNVPYPFGLVGADGKSLALDEALFAVEENDDAGTRTVAFHYRGPAGEASKTFTFRRDGLFDVAIEVDRPANWALWLGPGIRNPTPEELKNRFEIRAGVYRAGGRFERVDAKKAESPLVLPGSGLEWTGLEDHYFLTATIPRTPVRGARFEPYLVEPAGEGWRFVPMPPKDALTAEQKEFQRDFALVIEPAGRELGVTDYWGAKKIRRLAELPFSLGDTVDLGWFWFIARPLFSGMVWIHDNLVHNYGWAIVLLTVVIKIVLFPLTHKSYTSMQKMQELNPKMQAIRDRYKGKLKDAQGKPKLEIQRKMNEEVMALYKAEGVNPAGGCLPMLIQLPVLFAFYRLLSAAVELRGAPWILWLKDLSAPDPFYALPIIMGGTQFLQQRMMPKPAAASDQMMMQQRVLQLMPVFMTILFLGFPSGLVLYWLTNNVLTIGQQAIYNRHRKAKEAESGGGSGGEKGKAKKSKRTGA